jgi:DMSO/TMAO reductase YedYZ molybdopterin-dependent catalytic subunit
MKLSLSRDNPAAEHRILAAVVLIASLVFGSAAHADDRAIPPTTAANQNWVVSLGGKVKHPRQFDLETLQRLPRQQVMVSYQAGSGVEEASFIGVPLWTLLGEAGGIDDPAKRAELRHMIRITARDGYVVILSTGEIAPDFGAKPALLAYRRNDETPATAGFRLVMPGDKHGGRYVRDVVSIEVE